MSATADVTQANGVSTSDVLPRHGGSASRARHAGNKATSSDPADVVHNELTSKRLAREAALGHSLMNADDPSVQSQIFQEQSFAMQQAVALRGNLPQMAEQAALTRIAEQMMLQVMSDTRQTQKFRSERAKRDARYVTDERGGQAPGKSIESANTGGAAVS